MGSAGRRLHAYNVLVIILSAVSISRSYSPGLHARIGNIVGPQHRVKGGGAMRLYVNEWQLRYRRRLNSEVRSSALEGWDTLYGEDSFVGWSGGGGGASGLQTAPVSSVVEELADSTAVEGAAASGSARAGAAARAGTHDFRIELKFGDSGVGMRLGEAKSDVGELDLDTMRILNTKELDEGEAAAPTTPNVYKYKGGVFVSYVDPAKQAYALGVREGDLLLETSATVGDSTWPKSTLEGVRVALNSRLVLTKRNPTLVFSRPSNALMRSTVEETFELSLKRPIGLTLKQVYDPDQGERAVVISSISTSGPNVKVLEGVKVGDRVLAVESAVGNKMWPHSTVDGVVAAVNGRLPGMRACRIRFARTVDVGDFSPESSRSEETLNPNVINEALSSTVESFRTFTTTTPTSLLAPTGSKTHKMLLSRSAEILRNYLTNRDFNADSKDHNLPALAAGKVLSVLAEADAQLDAATLAVIMNSYLACRDATGAMNAFEACTGLSNRGMSVDLTNSFVWYGKDSTHRINPNVYAFDLRTGTSLLSAHALVGDFRSAVKVLKEMLQWEGNGGMDVDSCAWNACLSAAKSKEDYELARKLFTAMPDSKKTVITLNTMLSLHSRNKKLESAVKLLNKMKARRVLDKVSMTTMMKAYIDNNQVDKALEIFRQCDKFGIKHDATMYNTMIRGLVSMRDWDTTNEFTGQMTEENIAPNFMTYSFLMNGLMDAKKYSETIAVFETGMESPGDATSNVGLYTTAITAAARTKEFDKAIGYIGKMKLENLQPNVKTLTSLMNACISCGKGDVALDVYQTMKNGDDIVDGRATFTALRAYLQQNMWSEAFSILEAASEANAKAGGVFTGKELMEAYDLSLFSLTSAGEFDKSLECLSLVLRRGFVPSNQMMIGFMRGCNVVRNGGGTEHETHEADVLILKFLLEVVEMMMERKVPVSGSLYAYILHRLADQASHFGRNSDDSKLLLELGRAMETARVRDDNVLLRRGSPSEERGQGKWRDVPDALKRLGFGQASEICPPLLFVRIGTGETDKVGRAERRISRLSMPFNGARSARRNADTNFV